MSKKLSERLKKSYECGDVVGDGLAGYSDEVKDLEGLLMLCIKDMYSSSGKFKKNTARKIMAYVADNNIEPNP